MDSNKLIVVLEEMRKVHKLHKQLMSSFCHEMTPEQGKLLFLINDKSMNQKELAQALHITEATLSVRIKRLLDAGYIERRVDKNDKRTNAIVLSKQGKQHIDRMKESMKHYYELLSHGISDEDYDTVIRVIQKVQKNIKEKME